MMLEINSEYLLTISQSIDILHHKKNPTKLSYLIVGLNQDLVVLAECNQKHDGGYVLKTVDPLPPLRPLTPDIHHPDLSMVEEKKESPKRKQKVCQMTCLFIDKKEIIVHVIVVELLLLLKQVNKRKPQKAVHRIRIRISAKRL